MQFYYSSFSDTCLKYIVRCFTARGVEQELVLRNKTLSQG